MFLVSVVIPVYNSEKFLEKAVESALSLKEVGEIILVEDGSTDNSLEICKKIVFDKSNIRLIRHHDFGNHGAGASRNLGIKNAEFDYISFLDADDWYLENRFEKDQEIFEVHHDADAVYGATCFFYEQEGGLDIQKLTTIEGDIPPEKLVFELIKFKEKRFTTNAITFKKSFLNRVGEFNASLKLHQDTHYWIRSAFLGRLYQGQVYQPVAVRRVHRNNRNTNRNYDSLNLFFKQLFLDFLRIKPANRKVIWIIFKRYVGFKYQNSRFKLFFALYEVIRHPRLIFRFIGI